jgi:hypothetical protein
MYEECGLVGCKCPRFCLRHFIAFLWGSALLSEMFLISIMGTKSIEGEMSDGRGGGVSDTQGSGSVSETQGSDTQWSGDGGGSLSETQGSANVSDSQWSGDGGGVSQSNSVVADTGVVLADAGEGRVNGFRVVRHSRVAVQGANGALLRGADGGGVHGYRGGSVAHGWNTQDSGVGRGHQSGEDDKLQKNQSLVEACLIQSSSANRRFDVCKLHHVRRP